MTKKDNTLYVISILDRSGSMMGSENEVIGAYNHFIEQQAELAKEKDIRIKTTLVIFDTVIETVYSDVSVHKTPKLDDSVYFPRGGTALNDAVGKTIQENANKKNVIVFIETDGFENASREYTGEKVKQLVEDKKDDGWDFNFVGADLDKATTVNIGVNLGIDINKTISVNKSAAGYATRNMAFASSTQAYVDEKFKS